MKTYPTFDWLALIGSRWVYLVAVAVGLLQALAFDIAFDSALTWAAPILSFSSLLVFLWILPRLSVKRGVIFGYCFGLAYLGWGLNWVYISMANYGGAPLSFAVLANVGVVAYLSLYWLLGAFLIHRLGKTVNQRLLLAAPIIALLEGLRAVFLIGFPWLSVGYAWVDSPISHLASFGGVFLLSFVVVLLAGLCLLTIRRFHKGLILIKVLVLIAIFCLPFFPPTEGNPVNVALVQGNMPVITKYNSKRMDKNLLQYQRLTEEALAKDQAIDVVIWAETAIPYFYADAEVFLNTMRTLQLEKDFALISGAPHFIDGRYYNSVLLQTAKTQADTTFYYKQHLLPFGEYLPFRRFLGFFKNYVEIPMADFSRGAVIQPPFNVGLNRFAPSICFEAVFGNEIRQNAKQADILLNISNDAWFGKSKAQRQHLNIARMRAIENQKYLVRATNNGITAVIAPNGEVVKSLPPFTEGVLTATVSGNDKTTLYAKWGDMPWLIVFGIFGVGVITVSRLGKEKFTPR